MIRLLAISGLVAGAALVMFAERLGLSFAVAEYMLLAIAGLALLVIALTSVTSHLAPFLAGAERPRAGAVAVLQALHLIGAIIVAGKGAWPALPVIALVASFYLLGLMIMPRMERQPRSGALGMPALRGDEALMMSGVIGMLSALAFTVLIAALPGWIGPGIARLAEQPERIPLLLGLALIFGGLLAVQHLAASLIALAMLFVALPFTIELLRDIPDPAALRGGLSGLAQAIAGMLPENPSAYLRADAITAVTPEYALAMAAGLVGGMLAAPQAMSLPTRAARCFTALLSIVIALCVAGLIPLAMSGLEAGFMRDFVAQPPARWPFFAFDEAIRSWLTVCGQVPADVEDVLEACRTANRALPLPREAFEITRDMQLPALAASRGMPVVLGTMWLLIAGLAGLVGLAALLHRAATAFSETILFGLLHRKALRAGRLLAARLTIIAILVAFWQLDLRLVPDSAGVRFTLIAGILLLASTFAAIIVRRVVGLINRWRKRRRDDAPADPEPGAPAPALALVEQAA